MNTKELAKELGCSLDQVRALIRAGDLPAVNISLTGCRPRWRVKRSDFDAFVEARRSIPRKTGTRNRMPAPVRQWV